MSERKRIELRSIGQPRAAVLTLFIGIAAIFIFVFIFCAVVIGGARAQSGASCADFERCRAEEGGGAV